MAPSNLPIDEMVNEFVVLNRRRLYGTPPLGVADLERWQSLRQTLEQRLGDQFEGLLAIVERRAHFRFPTHLEVRFESGEELRSACLENISEGGIFVTTQRPLPAGTPLRLWISVAGGRAEMAGRVAWVRPKDSSAGPAGMGVRFADLSDEQREQIAQVVSRMSHRPGHA